MSRHDKISISAPGFHDPDPANTVLTRSPLSIRPPFHEQRQRLHDTGKIQEYASVIVVEIGQVVGEVGETVPEPELHMITDIA